MQMHQVSCNSSDIQMDIQSTESPGNISESRGGSNEVLPPFWWLCYLKKH